MKKIRSIKYIDIFTNTNDSNLDFVIDITEPPYYNHSNDIDKTIIDIGNIIYNKSLKFGFSKVEASVFAKKAIQDNLNKYKVKRDVKKIIMKIYDSNRYNYNNDNKNDKYFLIEEDNDSKTIIRDHNPFVLCILNEISDIDAKFIKIILDKKKEICEIKYSNISNKIIKVLDLSITNKKINFLIKNIRDNKYALKINDGGNSITVSFFDNIIFSMSKINLSNIIKDNINKMDKSENTIIKSEDTIIKSEDTIIKSEDTIIRSEKTYKKRKIFNKKYLFLKK
jgi:hypothetical protein